VNNPAKPPIPASNMSYVNQQPQQQPKVCIFCCFFDFIFVFLVVVSCFYTKITAAAIC